MDMGRLKPLQFTEVYRGLWRCTSPLGDEYRVSYHRGLEYRAYLNDPDKRAAEGVFISYRRAREWCENHFSDRVAECFQ